MMHNPFATWEQPEWLEHYMRKQLSCVSPKGRRGRLGTPPNICNGV